MLLSERPSVDPLASSGATFWATRSSRTIRVEGDRLEVSGPTTLEIGLANDSSVQMSGGLYFSRRRLSRPLVATERASRIATVIPPLGRPLCIHVWSVKGEQ